MITKPIPKLLNSYVPFGFVEISPLFKSAENSPKPLTVAVLSNHIGFFLLSKEVLSRVIPLYETKTESATVGLSPVPSLFIT